MNNYGWDVIYAIRTNQVTQDLQANMSKLITSFSYTGLIGDISYTISGYFKPWSIKNIHSSTNIGVVCPTKDCSIKITRKGKITTTSLTGITPIMQFSLAFLDGEIDHKKVLKFSAFESNETKDMNNDVVVVNFDSTNIISDSTLKTILNTAWHEVFWQNRKSLDYIFATVNLVPPDNSSWMAPKELIYHFW